MDSFNIPSTTNRSFSLYDITDWVESFLEAEIAISGINEIISSK